MKTKTRQTTLYVLTAALLALTSALMPAQTVRAATTVVYVSAGATGANNGTSWANAYTSLQSALAAANPAAGDTVQIWVAAGSHKPGASGNVYATFQLKNRVEIYGGFAGTESALGQRDLSTNVTTLSGDLDNSTNHTPADAYNVVTGSNTDATAILDGFTISLGASNAYGGGMVISYGSPTLRNLTFSDNVSVVGGGGMEVSNGSPTLTNVVFRSNSAFQGGGLMASYGSPVLTNVTFYGNSATYGGGVVVGISGAVTLVNAILWGNTTQNGPQINPMNGTANVSYSIVQGGYSGTGNSSSDPKFVSATSGDLHLSAGSPAIDAGNNAAVPSGVTIDRDGHARFFDDPGKTDTGSGTAPIVDMGAYEFQGYTPTTVTINQAAGQADPTGYGTINFTVIFSIPVSDFATGDVTLSGTAGATTAEVTGSGTTYNVAVSGMTSIGTVIATVPADAAHDSGGHGNLASTSTDNQVTYGTCVTSGTLYVNASATGANTGASWTDAYTGLQSALLIACPNPDQIMQIWVAAGTYKPTSSTTDRGATFQLKNRMELYGGFAGTETALGQRDWQTNVTTLSGDINNSGGSNLGDSYHVVVANGVDSTAKLDGFTVSFGYDSNSAGGVAIPSGSPTLSNLVISYNHGWSGGGVYVGNGASPTLTNVTISYNEAKDGGGLCSIIGTPTLTNVAFIGNYARNDSGGMYSLGAGGTGNTGSVSLTNVVFRGNSADFQAGGMGFYEWYTQPRYYGGSLALTNVLFSGNIVKSSNGVGGGLTFTDGSATLTNVTFTGNYGKGGALYVADNLVMRNSILWNNAAANSAYAEIFLYGSGYTASIARSDIQGGCTYNAPASCGEGNLNADPLFVAPISPSSTTPNTGGDFSLSAGSPAIDAGDNTAVPGGVTTDVSGNLRFKDDTGKLDTGVGTAPIVDMGAYEFQGATPLTVKIDQAPSQADPAGASPVNFVVVFSARVNDFAAGDVTLGGTAPGTLQGSVSEIEPYNGTTYNVAVSGMTGDGTVTAAIGAGVAGLTFDPQNPNLASTSTDNVVAYVTCDSSVTRLYVDDGATGANDGTSWANAYTSLQSALLKACPASPQTAQIWVAAGTYKPTSGADRSQSFVLENQVELYGGFAGTEAALSQRNWRTNVATLSGDLDGSGTTTSADSYHVVDGGLVDSTAVLDGFTISFGSADTVYVASQGGGIYIAMGSPTLSNLIISKNNAWLSGGGLYVIGGLGRGNPALTNVAFIENTANGGDWSHGWGAGMDVESDSSPTLTNVIFRGNTASGPGGGLRVYGYGSYPVLTNVTFYGNSASNGGAVDLTYEQQSSLTLVNSILWGNTATLNGNQIYGSPAVSYSIVQGGWSGTGNSSADPLFRDAATGNLHLSSGSPAIDAGSNAAVPSGVTTDFDGLARLYDGDSNGTATVDMGAFEYQPVAPAITTQPLSQEVPAGDTASFSAAASGYPDPTVHWEFLSTDSGAIWTDIGGATTSPLSFTAAFAQNGYKYRAVFTNSEGSATSNAATLTISKLTANCNVSGWTGTYDGSAHGASGTCTGADGAALEGLVLGDTFTDAPGGTAHWTFTDVTGNYNDQSGDAAIVINKAGATCNVLGWGGTYDGSAHGASGLCTGLGGTELSGLDLGGTFTDVPGGTAHWTFSNTNYNDQSADVAIVINKADAACNVLDWSGPYDGQAHGASGSCTGLGGTELSGLDLGGTFTDVPGGTAHWTFSNTNYNDQSGDAAIVINKADAICSISGWSGTYDGQGHGASGPCTGVGGATLSGLNLGSTFTDVPGGTAHWTFSNTNYNDQSGDVAIVINKADQTINFGPLSNKTYGDADFTVSATGGGSGNPVTFSASPSTVCTSSGGDGSTIHIVDVGTCTVTASQAGNSNYNDATPVSQSFTVNPAGFTLHYAAGAGGTLTGNTSQTVNYGADGTAVTAVANTGYHFVNWSDGSTANPRTDTNVTANVDVTANFAIDTFTLHYAAGAGGTLTGNTSQTVNYGENGTAVTAVANTGYHFVNWSDGSTANPRTDTNVTANVDVTANFAPLVTYTLSVKLVGGGKVTADPPDAFTCAPPTRGWTLCTGVYGAGAQVKLTAAPDNGYRLSGWSGACTGTGDCTVGMTADKSVTATFTKLPTGELTVTKAGAGEGTISAVPLDKFTCESTSCEGSYPLGTVVTLTATPDASSVFAGWSEYSNTYCSVSGTNLVCTLNADITAKATFTKPTYTLAVTVTGPAGKGYVMASPLPIGLSSAKCSIGKTGTTTCTWSYYAGTSVQLTATASSGYKLLAWSGDCTGSNSSCTVTITADRSVTASFAKR